MPDRLVVLWRIEDIFGPALINWMVDAGDPAGLVGTMSGSWVPWSVRPPRTPALPMVVDIPPVPEPAWLDPLDTRSSIRLTVLHGRLVEAFLEGLDQAPVTLVDLRAAASGPTAPPGPTTPATT